MTGVVVWLIGVAVGGTVGWWLGREVNRGMPWGVLALGVASVLAAVAAPFLWPEVFTRVTAAATIGFGAGFVTMATVTVESDLAERGHGLPPGPDTGPDVDPGADPHPDPDIGGR